MASTIGAPAKEAMEIPGIGDAILEAIPTLMSALDEVASIHPFVSGARSIFNYHKAFLIFYF